MHVLMVDDETEFLEIMKKRLGRRSMDITTASNGMDGLKCVQAMTDGTGCGGHGRAHAGHGWS